jgi:hypothetical protein
MTPREPSSTPLPFRESLFDRLTTHTYRVLSRAKERELNYAQERISQAYQILKHKAQQGENIQGVAALRYLGTALKNMVELPF